MLVPLVLDQHLDQLVVHDLHVNLERLNVILREQLKNLIFVERFRQQLSVPLQNAGVVGKLVQLVDVILVRVCPDTCFTSQLCMFSCHVGRKV